MNYYNEIKENLINNEIVKRVKDYSKNKSDLETYYKVGKLLSEAGKHYGEGIIKKYSIKLTSELGKGYTQTRLKYFRRFYNVFSNSPTLSDKLTYSHYCEIIWFEKSKLNYYMNISLNYNLSVRDLRKRIKSKEYERLPDDTRNKLISDEQVNITETIKEPIMIKVNNIDKDKISEKVLHKVILENISEFMEELGLGYSFIKNEYKIKLGDIYNYIDLLLFNIKFNCYVVIELKVTKLRKEHIGQIGTYMNYIDKNLKTIYQNKTIGVILVRKNNKFIIEYTSDDRIISRNYELIY